MIVRIWLGWTAPDNADRCEELLRSFPASWLCPAEERLTRVNTAI